MYSGTEFASLADQYGFIVVYPSVTRSGLCFDVSTAGALTHNGNSDPVGIVSMVQWEEQHRGVSRAHRVAILEQGKWIDRKYTMRDMQFAVHGISELSFAGAAIDLNH